MKKRISSSWITTLLRLQQVPYIVIILASASGWILTHLISKITEAPTVEYKVDTARIDAERTEIAITLQNLSSRVMFSNVGFILTFSPSSTSNFVGSPSILPIEPAYEGNVAPQRTKSSVKFNISSFHPGNQFILRAKYQGDAMPFFQLASSEDAMHLARSSLVTCFVKNEVSVLFSLFGLAIALVTISMSLQIRKYTISYGKKVNS